MNRQMTRMVSPPQGPLLSVKVSSPTEGVVGVRIDHFRHLDPFPSIPLFPDDKPISNVTLTNSGTARSLTTGGLTAEITENPYTITFKSPTRTLTSAGPKHQAIFDVPSRWTTGTAANSSCLALDPSSNPNPERVPETVRYMHSGRDRKTHFFFDPIFTFLHDRTQHLSWRADLWNGRAIWRFREERYALLRLRTVHPI